MAWADACVAIQPFGRSASLELGWFIGMHKPAILLLAEGQEPELMFALADMCLNLAEVIELLGKLQTVNEAGE